jgi:hypothetical protein
MYSVTFYGYKLEENKLSISISKRDDSYLVTETHIINPLDSSFPPYIKEVLFDSYIPMLHYLIEAFNEFYEEHVTYMPYSIDKLPPTYYITDICGLSINNYILSANKAKLEMKNSIVLYHDIIKDIRSKLAKTKFRLLTIKIENEKLKHLYTLCITSDLIVQFF